MGRVDTIRLPILWAQAPDVNEDGTVASTFDQASHHEQVLSAAFTGGIPEKAALPEGHVCGVFSDTERFRQELVSSRNALGLAPEIMATGLGWKGAEALLNYESGTVKEYRDGRAQAFAVFYQLPFDFLDYDGPPRTTAQDIIKNLIARTWTLGINLDSHAFADFAGKSFDEIRAGIFAQPRSAEICTLLTEKFRMRLWPEAGRGMAPAATLVADEIRELLSVWHMTARDLGEELTELAHEKGVKRSGVSPAEINKFLASPNEECGAYKSLAGLLGYSVQRTKPRIEDLQASEQIYFYNSALADEIEARLKLTGTSLNELSRRTGVFNLPLLLKTLRKVFGPDELVPPLVARENVQHISSELKIRTATLDNLNDLHVAPQKDRETTVAQIVLELKARQRAMRYSKNNLVEMTKDRAGAGNGCAEESITAVLSGNVTLDNLHVLERLCEILHVIFDPYSFMHPVVMTKDATAENVGELLREQIDHRAIISRQNICQKLGVSHAHLNHYFGGRYHSDENFPALLKLCRCVERQGDAIVTAHAESQQTQAVHEVLAEKDLVENDLPGTAPDALVLQSAERRNGDRWWEDKRQAAVRNAVAERRARLHQNILRRHEILPPINVPQNRDAHLAGLVRSRIQLLGLSAREFYSACGTHRDTAMEVFAILEQEVATRDTLCFRGHDALRKMTEFLLIPLVQRENLEPLVFVPTGDWNADMPNLVAEISCRRRALLVTHKQVMDATGVAIAAQQEMESGTLRSRSLDYIKILMEYFGVTSAVMPEVWPVFAEKKKTEKGDRVKRVRPEKIENQIVDVEKSEDIKQAKQEAEQRAAQARADRERARAERAEQIRLERERKAQEKKLQAAAAKSKDATQKPPAPIKKIPVPKPHLDDMTVRLLREAALKKEAKVVAQARQDVSPEKTVPSKIDQELVARAQAQRTQQIRARIHLLQTGVPLLVFADRVSNRSEKKVWLEAVQARYHLHYNLTIRDLAAHINLERYAASQYVRGLQEALNGNDREADRQREHASIDLKSPAALLLAQYFGVYTSEMLKQLASREGNHTLNPTRLPDRIDNGSFLNLAARLDLDV